MTRRMMHAVFAALALVLALISVWHAVHWHRAATIKNAVEHIQSLPAETIDRSLAQQEWPSPEEALAAATQLIGVGEYESAETLLTRILRTHEADAIGKVARFNLGNAYLQQGLESAAAGQRAGPLLALAKQRYRELLHLQPDHWDARYNLERALQLAPELPDPSDPDKGDPTKSVRVVVPDFTLKDLP